MTLEIEYEADLLRVLRKLDRANTRHTGTRLSWDDVAILSHEFDGLFDETATRCERALKGIED